MDRVFGLAKEAGFDGIVVAEFLRRLNQNGYKGIVTLELQPEALGDGDLGWVSANLRVTVDFYRRHFAWQGS